MNLVSSWKKRSKDKYGTITKGVDRLNMICGTEIRLQDISTMQSGKRNIPACINKLMLIDVLLTALEDAGMENAVFELSSDDYMELIDKISPPERKK
jgi:hypothetical protein